MFFDIIKTKYLDQYKLHIEFENGKKGIVDFQNYVMLDTVFYKFSDVNYFKRFSIDDGILTWGSGELDIAPETVYEKATGDIIDLG